MSRKPPNYKQMQEANRKDFMIINNQRRKCECGHAIDFKGYSEYKRCTWCGRIVYATERAQFKHEMEKRLKKLKD